MQKRKLCKNLNQAKTKTGQKVKLLGKNLKYAKAINSK